MHMITSTERRRVAFWAGLHWMIASRACVGLLKCSSALVGARKRTAFMHAIYVRTRSLALEQRGWEIDEWRWRSWSFVFAGQPAVDHPVAFGWHASSKKNGQTYCIFPFQMVTVLPLRKAWLADILSQASLHDVQGEHCWKRGIAETGRDCGTTARLSDLSMPFRLCTSPLKGEARRSPKPSARPSAAADGQICTTCLFTESVGL